MDNTLVKMRVKMRKYFYLVYYEYKDGDIVGAFNLGVFSSKKNANKKIDMTKELSGFKKYGDLFKIIKFLVEFDHEIKKNITLYYVWLEHDDYYEIFDYFSSIQKATEQSKYYKHHTRIGKKYPNDIQISSVLVDDYKSWSEGFD